MLLSGSARAQNGSHGFHRDSTGRQWVVVSDQNGAFSLRRFDSGGALLGEVSLSSASDNSDFKIASDPGGDAWVSGGTSDGGPAGFGVWHVSADGLTLISSAAVYGAFDIFAGGIAVDASSRVWVSAPEVTSAEFAVKFALWRFEYDGSLSAGFPKYQQRAGGILDAGLSIAIDSGGDIWSAGVSSNPAAAAYDLALWRYDPDGNLRSGFPVYRGSAFASLDEIDSGIVIAAGDKVWVASSQLFPGCADRQQALFRFDRNGTVELQRYWHNAAENESTGETIALASDGSPWMLGRSSNTAAVWSYDRFGTLEPGFPRTDNNLDLSGIALDAGDVPWVVYGSTPGAFSGAQAVAGASGLPACAQLAGGNVAGAVIVEGGAPAGSSVTIVASSEGFHGEGVISATVVSTGGTSVPFSIELVTPGDWTIGAFLGENPDDINLSTPIGFYNGFTPVSLAPGASASGIDFTIALDTVAPVTALTFPIAGSTIAVLPVVEGVSVDANGVNGDIELAVQDTNANLWWDSSVSAWVASTAAVYRNANADSLGTGGAIEWSVRISSADNGNFGRLDERLIRGRLYRVLARDRDFVGRDSEPAETWFTWNGGQPPPEGLNGQALGVSSIAWSWSAVQGATAYFLASSSFTAPFISVTTTSFIDTGLAPALSRRLCVAAANDLAVDAYSCALTETDPAAPGAVVASVVNTNSVTWVWTDGGNAGDAGFELTLSTDGFVSNVSTPVPVGASFHGTSYQVTDLNPDTVYTARVRAYNGSLKLSGFSATGSTRTHSVPVVPPSQYNSHGFHRDSTGRQWVVVSDQNEAFLLRRFDSAGALLGQVSLSSASDNSSFTIASDPGGDAWVSGGTNDGGPAGFGVWHVSSDGQTLISSAAVYGTYDIFAGGIAVDASSKVWVAAPEVTSVDFTVRFALWRFEYDGALSAGFPKYQQRAGGILDAGLSIAIDSGGDIWSAGVSSNPAASAYDLALWRYDSSGALRPGFPVYRGSAFVDLDDIDSGIVIAAGDKVWVAASQLFPGCAEKQHALFRFDTNGTVELQRYWHNTAENSSKGQSIALTSDGSPWVLGRSSDTTAVWSYDRFGALEPGFPRTDNDLNPNGIALDAGDAPWVVYSSTPGAFIGAQSVAGAAGLPSCAQLTGGTIDGSVTVVGGVPAGSSVTIVASSEGFHNDALLLATFVSTGGASMPFTIEIETPGDFVIGAFLGENPEAIDLSTPIGFYRDFTPVSLAPGASASGIDFAIDLDTVPPAIAVTFPVAGSTIAALPVIEGVAADAVGVNGDIKLAVQDATADLWWDTTVGRWVASASDLFGDTNATSSGSPGELEWSVKTSSTEYANFGRLDERLVQGHHYRVLAHTSDFVGHVSISTAVQFTWSGPTGDVGPQAPNNLIGTALGVSSASWTWDLSSGATAYFLARSSFTAPFASVAAPPYIETDLAPSERRFLCVAGVNLLTTGAYNCGFVDADPAQPGPVFAVTVGTQSVAWAWTDGGNGSRAYYTLNLSTDNFVTSFSTPTPVGSFFASTSLFTSGLSPDTVYSARVRAYNLDLKLSEFSASGSTRTLTSAPDAPYNLTALFDRAEAKVSLSWSAPVSGQSPASYRVYRSTVISSLALLAGTTETAYVDYPSSSAFYFYAVSALSALGAEGPRSAAQAVRFDVTPPSVALVQPANGATLSRPYTVIASASDDFTSATVRFDIDGIARATTTVTHQFFWDIRAETDGLHSVRAVATDDDGNQAQVVRSVIVAYSTPTSPVIYGPFDNFSSQATVLTINGSAPPLTSVRVLAGAVVIGTAVPDGNSLWSLPSVSLPGYGDFLLTAVAFEDRGESAASAPIRVAAFAEHPTEPGSVSAVVDRQAARVALSWSASTGTTPATAYRVERATVVWGSYAFLASTPTTSYNDAPFASGDYVYRVRAEHGSGLFSAYVSTTALYDATPPAPIGDLNIVGSRPPLGEVDLTWTAAVDDLSGVAQYKLYASTSTQFTGITPQTIDGATTSFTATVTTTTVWFFAIRSVDGAGNESNLSNTAVFDLIAPTITSVDVTPGQVLSRPRAVTVVAADAGSQPRVIFSVDGVALSTVAAPPYSILFDVSALTDGSHTLGITAIDGSGNSASTSRSFIVNYFPPPVPVITSPAQNFHTASSLLSVSGTGEPGITVEIYVNGSFAGSTTVSGLFGSFTAADLSLPAEGAIAVTAVAKDQRGSSPPSAAVNIVLDFGPPGIPQLPTAQALNAGRIRLTWLPPSGEVPSIYRIYRSTDETQLVQGSTASASLRVGSVAAAEFVDITPGDGLYFYGVSAVDAASNEGLLSEIAPAVADGVAPTAAVLLPQSTPPLAPGQHLIHLSLSEALATPPILTFTPQGRIPAVIALTGITTTLWQGTATINASINADYGTFAFQGSDFLGNVGTTIVSGGTVTLNARGPVGSVSVSSALASVGTQAVTLSLNEPAASTPTLTVTPFGHAAIPIGLTGSGLLWSGALAISTGIGDGSAAIGFSAVDSVGNVGSNLTGGATYFVIDTTPPTAPLDLSATARPGGTVNLLWSAPLGERPVSYFVFRDGVRLASPITPALNGSGSFTDSPSEGAHDYEVTGVDAAANEGPASNSVNSSADQTAPPSPLNLVASAQTQSGSDGIELTWTPGAGETAAVVRLYRSTSPIVGLAGLPFQISTASPYFEVPAEDARYYYAATALDLAGNESGASNQADLLFLNAAPRIAVSGVQNGAYYNYDVNPAFSAFDLNLNAVSALLDGVPFTSGALVSAAGAHTLIVSASDTGGHVSSATVVFTIDKIAPLITLSGIANGALLHSTAAVAIVVTDLSPVTTAHVLTNITLAASVAYASGDLIDDDGSFVLVASATDRAGNTATQSLAFSFDGAPRVPLSLAARLEEGVGADISWVKPGADVLAYRVYKNGARVSSSLHTPTTFRDTSYASDAQHVYEVTAVDQLGQEGPRAKITIPPVGLTLAGYGLVVSGQEALTRGFSDTLRLGLANRDNQTRLLGPADLELTAGGQVYATAQAGAVSVGAGANGEASGVVTVSPALPSSVMLRATLAIPTETGTTAVLVKSLTLLVREPAAPVVEVFTGALIRGALTQVRVKLNNRGSAPFEVRTAVVEGFTPSPANEVSASLNTLEGTVLSQAGLVQAAGTGITARVEGGKLTYFATVEAGTSFLFDAVEVDVPESAGDSLTVSGRVKTFTGTQSQAAVAAPAYTATVAPAQPVYDQGSQVTLSGEARDQAQALLGGATVQLRIVSKGYTRTLTTVTAPSGAYSVVFNPLPNEAGVYSLSASAPEAVSNAAQSSFTIVGFGFSPTTLTARLNQNSSLALNVNLTNTGESAVTGLTLQLEGVPAGVNLVLGGAPSTLLAGVQGPLSLRVEASPTAAIGQSMPVVVARDSNGFERRLPITVEVTGSQPIPRVTPQAFQVGMLAGEVRRQVILLENIGFSAWENVTLSSPTLPWVKITGTGNMGSIPPGGNASFGISFEPPADLPTGQFVQNPLIEVRSGNSAMIPVNVGVTITSSKQGNLAFTVINADRPRDAQGNGVPVPGADVTLTSLDIAGLTFNGKVGVNGVVSFTGIPSGSYNWRTQATNFGPTSGIKLVESGLTGEVEVFLFTSMVTYEWGVTETTIQDKYDLTLGVTFKTDVLAPALVVEPSFIEVPIGAGESMLTQYTITNKGLVSAFNLNVKPALKDDAVLLETPFATIPELKAGQSVVIPVKVTLIHASPCHYEELVHSAQYRCISGIEGSCIISNVIFKVGKGADCVSNGILGITEQEVSKIVGSAPPQAPCRCALSIVGPATIDLNATANYTVGMSQTDCPCSLQCNVESEWTAPGGFEIVSQGGSGKACYATVRANSGGGGNLIFRKSGLASCVSPPKVITVNPKLVIDSPTGDPVTAGSTQNEFTFATAAGMVVVPLQAHVLGSSAGTTVRWTFDAVPDGSALSWSGGSGGVGLNVQAVFTGYPSHNHHFNGPSNFRTVTAELIRAGQVIDTKTARFQLFFERNTVAASRAVTGEPNWFFYWNETFAGDVNAIWGAPSDGIGETPAMLFWQSYSGPRNRLVIGAGANGTHNRRDGTGLTVTGIGMFANVIRHERKHVEQVVASNAAQPFYTGVTGILRNAASAGWSFNVPAPASPWNHFIDNGDGVFGAGDIDVDSNRDDLSDGTGPTAADFANCATPGVPIECQAQRAETSADLNFADVDWANPGKQHH